MTGPGTLQANFVPSSPPTAPRSLQAAAGSGSISLSWLAPASDGGSAVTNYKVYRGTSSGSETLLTTIGSVLSFTDTGLTNGQTYYYQVTALNGVGESGRSNEASATPTAPLVTVTFNDAPASSGTITCGTQTFSNGQSGQFPQNSMLTCTASATANQQFSSWSGLATGSANPITFNVGSGGTVIANYGPILVTVTFHENPTNAGTITCGTQSYSDGQSGQYQQNSQASCTANPASGYVFSSWSGLASGTTNPVTLNVGTGGSVSASFTAAQGTVTFNDNPLSGGTITCGS